MATPTRHQLMTYDALVALPSTQDHDRTELIEGVPIVSPSPTRKHQETAGRLHVLMHQALVVHPIGNVYFAPVDVRLSPTTVLQPDLLVLRTEHLARYAPEGFVDGPPDLVVEVISPFSRARDEEIKRAHYERAGVAEYWLVDPEHERVTVLTLTEVRYQVVAPGTGGSTSNLIPGLVIDPKTLFAPL